MTNFIDWLIKKMFLKNPITNIKISHSEPCSICYENMTHPCRLPCFKNHVFCFDCIQNLQNPCCPICRASITDEYLNTIHKLYGAPKEMVEKSIDYLIKRK